jgi:glycosyltransferase involved in cell wall biosynthesis
MKILIDVRCLSKGKTSGIEEYTRLLVGHILKHDTENRYQLFYNGFKKAPLPADWLTKANVSVMDWRIPNKLLDFSLKFFGLPKIDSFAGPDVIFSPHFNLIRAGRDTKRVITFHDLSFAHFPEFYPLRKRFWHWQQDYARQAEKADAIIAVSDFTGHDLVETLKIDPKKVRVIYAGIDPYLGIMKKEELDEFRRKKTIDFPFLLYVGTIEPRKNIRAIVKAFNELKKDDRRKNLKLLVVGEKGWLFGDTLEEAAASPFSEDIVFWGKATAEELRALYNLASVFVYPSFFEGFGFPPLEAQTCGVPVVASNRSSLPEILGCSALLVDPWRPYEIKAAVEAFLDDAALRDEFVSRGFTNIKRFSWDTMVKDLISVFHSLEAQKNA